MLKGGGALFSVVFATLCLFVHRIFSHLKLDSICVVCNILFFNTSSFYLLSATNSRNVMPIRMSNAYASAY